VFFYVPHLLRHETSALTVSSEGLAPTSDSEIRTDLYVATLTIAPRGRLSIHFVKKYSDYSEVKKDAGFLRIYIVWETLRHQVYIFILRLFFTLMMQTFYFRKYLLFTMCILKANLRRLRKSHTIFKSKQGIDVAWIQILQRRGGMPPEAIDILSTGKAWFCLPRQQSRLPQ
jgi:hypothetical protein